MGINDEYLQLSGIQHFRFCKRQWALIHIEQQWEENVKTVEGQYLHRHADQPFTREKRGGKLIVRALPIKSDELRLSGICDVVEFNQSADGIELDGEEGKYLPCPVEYKRGKPKSKDEDIVQLAAQAICLEEMLLCQVEIGYIFYHEIKHRIEVAISADVKREVKQIAADMHELYQRRHTPKVKTGPFCRGCSLQNICMPALMKKQPVKSYIERNLEA